MIKKTLVVLLVTIVSTSVHGDFGYFWQVTDLHYDPTYNKSSLGCDLTRADDYYGPFGDMWCDAPWALVESCVEAMKTLKADVDFIAWTGDRVTHAPVPEVNHTFNAGIHNKTTELMKATFPGVPVYATFGNLDSYPKNQFHPENTLLYNETYDIWRSWINDDSQEEYFLRGGYYAVKISANIRLVVPNTNLWFIANKLVTGTGDPAGQFAWLNKTLGEAKEQNEKVIVLSHIPPGVPRPPKRTAYYPEYNSRLLDLLNDYADIIVALHFGHFHCDEFKVLKNKAGSPTIPMFIAPSVATGRFLPIAIDPMHNPGFRLIKYDRVTGKHIEFTQYYLDLPEANKAGVANWKLEYTTTNAYNLSDLTAASLHDLTEKLKDPSGKEFVNYKKYYDVSPPEDLSAECNSKCHAVMVCGMIEFTHDDVDACAQKVMQVSEATQVTLSKVLFCFLIGFLSVARFIQE